MRSTDQDWSAIAQTAPYWGVLSSDEYRGTELPQDRQVQFFASGETLIEGVFSDIRALKPGFSPRRALDFGCGVGRVLIPIARRSAEAVGVDVAPRMLELAHTHTQQAGLKNVLLVQGDDQLSALTGTFDFVHSVIVLQHIPPERGYNYVRRMIEKLDGGGVFALHFCFAKSRDLLVHEMPMAKYYRREGNVLRDMIPTHEHPVGTVTMFDYDLNEIFALLSEFVSQPIIARLIPESHLGIYLIGQRSKP